VQNHKSLLAADNSCIHLLLGHFSDKSSLNEHVTIAQKIPNSMEIWMQVQMSQLHVVYT